MHSFCPAASGNRVLHTPSRLSERCPVPLDDVAQKQRTSETRTRLEERHTPGWIIASHADGGHALELL